VLFCELIKKLEDAGFEVRTAHTAAAAQHGTAQQRFTQLACVNMLAAVVLSQVLQYWCGPSSS
jgi:hypothetical protein